MITKHSRILAIDPGTRDAGIAVLQGSRLIYHGVVTMSYRRGLDAVRRSANLLVQELLRDFRPTVLLVEENSIGGSGIRSRLHAVVGEIRRIGRREGLEVMTKAASTVKKCVAGSGRASKEAVARAVARHYPELRAYLRQTAKWERSTTGHVRCRGLGNRRAGVAFPRKLSRSVISFSKPIARLASRRAGVSASRVQATPRHALHEGTCRRLPVVRMLALFC